MIQPSKILRSKRKTLSISINSVGEVIVKAPLGLPDSHIYNFLLEKQQWIQSRLNKTKSSIDKFAEVVQYKKLLVLGSIYPGVYSSGVRKITILPDKIVIPDTIPQEKLMRKITNWYKKLAQELLIGRLSELSNMININYSSAKCTGSRGRWGSCNNKHAITLNWRAVMLPQQLIDYIIVHELSHIIELNHSTKFWQIVAKIMPSYKQRRQELKQYGFVLKLF